MSSHSLRYRKGDYIGEHYFVYDALAGGMGEVYLCLDLKDDSDIIPIALKTFRAQTGQDLQSQFYNEVLNWIALEAHSNIVQCYTLLSLDQVQFMLLEWVHNESKKGTSLEEWLQYGPISVELVVKFASDIVAGLQYINTKVPGLVHRDLKPSNILIDDSLTAKITDFGLAAVIAKSDWPDETNSNTILLKQSTRIGNIVGTPLYMAPEQWTNNTFIDHRTDMYAVGCILYEMLMGEYLFDGYTIEELRKKHVSARIPRLPWHVPFALKKIIRRCLAKRPEDRYPDFSTLSDHLAILNRALTGELPVKAAIDPFTSTNYIARGIAYTELDKPQLAFDDYTQAIELSPKRHQAYINRGNIYLDRGEYQDALKDFGKAHERAPENAIPWHNMAVCYRLTDELEKALIYDNHAIQRDPQFTEAYIGLGLTYQSQEKIEEAFQFYNQAVEIDPMHARAYYHRAMFCRQLKKYDDAIVDFSTAIQLNPKDHKAYYGRGLCLTKQEKHEQAIQDFHDALRLQPDTVESHKELGQQYHTLGQYNRAISNFNKSILLSPTAKTYLNRGLSYVGLEKHDKALSDYNEALRLDPNSSSAYWHIGLVQYDLDQYEQAIVSFKQAISLKSDSFPYHYYLAKCFFATGRIVAATESFTKTITLNPTFIDGYLERGDCHLTLDQLDQAMIDFKKAQELDPKNGAAFHRLGAYYVKLNQHQEALSFFNQSIQLDPMEARAYSNRSLSLSELGNHQQALQDINQAIGFEPENIDFLLVRSAIYATVEHWDQMILDLTLVLDLSVDHIDLQPYGMDRASLLAQRGFAYLQKKQTTEAMASFNQALKLNQNTPLALVSRAEIYESIGEYRKAVDQFSQCIDMGLGDADIYFKRAILYSLHLRLFDQAITDFTKVINIDRYFDSVYLLRGVAYFSQGQIELAIQDFDQGIMQDPANEALQRARTHAYEQLGQILDILKGN